MNQDKWIQKRRADWIRKKVSFVDRHRFGVTYGKMMGYITDEPSETDDASKCLKVVFVNSDGGTT
jgi:hypothetical protein